MSNVILYGSGLQVLSIARSLRECQHNVYVVCDKTDRISKHCRYIKRCIFTNIDEIEALIAIINEEAIDVIIPMEDRWAYSLASHKEKIEAETKAKCAICSLQLYEMVSNKTTLMQFCAENNIPHPKTMIANNDYISALKDLSFPILIKPSYSEGARGIRIVESKNELLNILPNHIAEYGECSIQEYIENDHYYNVMLYRTSDGKYSNHVITNIKRFYPIKGGSSSLCTTIENDALLSICKNLLDKLNWVGFADFDVLEKGDGDFRIIEINPRVPASVRAAAISGINYGEIIVKNTLTSDLPNYIYSPGKHLRYLGLDIAWFISSPTRFKTSPSWFNFLGKNIYYQEGGYKDWRAMLESIISGINKIISPSFRKQKSGMN